MKQKTYKFTQYGETYEVSLEWSTYSNNNALALILETEEDGYWEEFAIVTVNLPESDHLGEDTQYVDENNLPGIGKWLEENGIATPTGISSPSGFCSYPAYKFNRSK